MKLIDVSIKFVKMLDVASFEVHPSVDGAYVSIMTRQIKKPIDIVLARGEFEVSFYAKDDFVEICIRESLDDTQAL